MQLSHLQRFGIECVESIVGDTWKQLITVARDAYNQDHDDEKRNCRNLCHNIHRMFDRLNLIADELKCRWAIDLGPFTSEDTIGLARVFLMEDLGRKSHASIRGSGADYYVATGHKDLTDALEKDFADAMEKMAPFIDEVGTSKWEDNIDHALETVMFNLVTFKATNDYLCDRFGEDDTGIIIYQSPNNKLAVRIYQCDGKREVLCL